jgi:hypothetical protein
VWSSIFANHVKNVVSHGTNRLAHRASRFNERRSCATRLVFLALSITLSPCSLRPQTSEANKPVEWKSVSFAIVRFNDEAPASWNIYHTSKRGVLLVKLWKRYLLVNVPEHQVFDIDPRTVKPQGDGVQWSTSDIPAEPLGISEWKDRNVGPVERLRFRLGKDGHILELQIPLRADGKPAY